MAVGKICSYGVLTLSDIFVSISSNSPWPLYSSWAYGFFFIVIPFANTARYTLSSNNLKYTNGRICKSLITKNYKNIDNFVIFANIRNHIRLFQYIPILLNSSPLTFLSLLLLHFYSCCFSNYPSFSYLLVVHI